MKWDKSMGYPPPPPPGCGPHTYKACFEWRTLHDGEVLEPGNWDEYPPQKPWIQGKPTEDQVLRIVRTGGVVGVRTYVLLLRLGLDGEIVTEDRVYPVADVRILARVPSGKTVTIINEMRGTVDLSTEAERWRVASAAMRRAAGRFSVGMARAAEDTRRFRAELERAEARRALAKQRPFLLKPRVRWSRWLLRLPATLLCAALWPVAWLWRRWTWRLFVGLLVVGVIVGGVRLL